MKLRNKLKHLKLSAILASFFAPVFAFAVTTDFNLAGGTFKTIIEYAVEIIYLIIPIFSALSVIVFFWGLSKFILNANKPEEIKVGRDYMMWGILVLFILLTFRVIVGIVSNEFFGGGTVVDESGVLLPGGGASVTTSNTFLHVDGTITQ